MGVGVKGFRKRDVKELGLGLTSCRAWQGPKIVMSDL